MFEIESCGEELESDSDLELQEAFVKGLVKPGLNTVSTVDKKQYKNNVVQLKQKLSDIQLKLDWIERLDLVNAQAPLAPELAHKLHEEELLHDAKLSKRKGKGHKMQNTLSEDPVLNDFRREMLFHRQAQAAVLIGIPKLKALGIKTKRPEDYFAEMSKSDQHMQKIREVLQRKKHVQERTERVRHQRELRKIGKKVQTQAKLRQASEKKELLEEVKKYRKGLRTDLDFLEDKKKQKGSGPQGNKKGSVDKKINTKRRYKDQKFGFGGKKRGLKKNTKSSTSDVSEFRRPGKPNRFGVSQKHQRPGKNGIPQKHQRPGKNKRIKMKAKKKKT